MIGENGADVVPEASVASDKADAAVRQQAAEVRRHIHQAVGQIVLALSAIPRYRHQTLADLQGLVLEPLMRDRIAIAAPAAKAGEEDDAMRGALAGIAFWASVSGEVDAKIREQIKGGAFPVRLKPDEWASGPHTWLLDVVAPSRNMASAVLANFRQVAKQASDVRIHPMVARQVDPEMLKKMGAQVSDDGVKS